MSHPSAFSNRWRVVAPGLAALSAIFGGASASAQDEDQRQQMPASPVADNPALDLTDPLTSMLSQAPISTLSYGGGAPYVGFADIAAQLASGGLTPPASLEDDEGISNWIEASYPLAIAEPFRSNALVLGADLVGFDITNIDQTLEISAPPYSVILIRGRFDQAAVLAAWEAQEYTLLEIDGVQAASLAEDVVLDLDKELNRIALARLNNAAFLPDGTLVYTSTLQLLRDVFAVASGTGESFAVQPDVAPLLASLDEPLVSAMLLPGLDLSASAQFPPSVMTDSDTFEKITEELNDPAPMPAILSGLMGVTAGGPTIIRTDGQEPRGDYPESTIVYRLLMAEPGSAEVAAEVADARLGKMESVVTRQPYSAIYGEWEATSLADGTILGLDLKPADGLPVSIWYRGYFSRDLLFLAW